MIDPFTAAGTLAGKELFTSLVRDLYQVIAAQTGRKIKHWNTERQITTRFC